MEDCQHLMSVTMLTANMFLSVFVLPEPGLSITTPKKMEALTEYCLLIPDSPWSPRINTSGGLEELKEKESVSITCSAPTPCPLSPPELTWNLQPDSGRQTQKNPDGTSTTKIQENMTLSDTHDGYNITCSVSYPVDGGKCLNTTETVTLHVSYAPKDTSASISPSGLVSAGSWVKLSCSSRAKPPVSSFSWFRISSEGPVQVSEEQLYSFNVSEGGEFYCVAANNLGNQTSSLICLEDKASGLSDHITAKILGLVILCSSVLMFECWFKSRFSLKPKKSLQESCPLPHRTSKLVATRYRKIDQPSYSEDSGNCDALQLLHHLPLLVQILQQNEKVNQQILKSIRDSDESLSRQDSEESEQRGRDPDFMTDEKMSASLSEGVLPLWEPSAPVAVAGCGGLDAFQVCLGGAGLAHLISVNRVF
ncbi:nectin-4 [Nothobranchius furzeri]|uniref:nectin-4 n=1 Tax=Nothobranchius furzeri TaxID=105023 RepID=UPI003904BE42